MKFIQYETVAKFIQKNAQRRPQLYGDGSTFKNTSKRENKIFSLGASSREN